MSLDVVRVGVFDLGSSFLATFGYDELVAWIPLPVCLVSRLHDTNLVEFDYLSLSNYEQNLTLSPATFLRRCAFDLSYNADIQWNDIIG
jgi:hypothetical protein